MKQLPKWPRVRLDRQGYSRLRYQVLERDGWRCQQCGRRGNLEVHHVQRRSQQGDDVLDNLTTLCRNCHDSQHR